MSKRVTYLLGAGSSANSLPILSQMADRMKRFLDFLKEKNVLIGENKYLDAIQNFESVFEEIQKHFTVDTYAKKLFLKNDFESKRELKTLKFFLSGYFLFEQVGTKFPNSQSQPTINKQKAEQSKRERELREIITKKLDDRYDVFLATLLVHFDRKLKLPSNINILSWNYDHQIELAYKDFTGLDIENTQILFNLFNSNGLNPDWASNNSQFIKLNGSAVNAFSKTHPTEVRYFNSSYSQIDSWQTIKRVLDYYNYSKQPYRGDLLEPALNFAWELNSNEVSKNNIERAKIICSQTEILVVIGYSFPTFNREIDRSLLLGANKLKKIYYQAPESHVKGLIQRLKGINSNEIEVVPHTELDQFFIPYEL